MEKENNKEKKIIPFKKAIVIFAIWALLLSAGGDFLYKYVLKPYIVDRPTIIKVEKPEGEATFDVEDKK